MLPLLRVLYPRQRAQVDQYLNIDVELPPAKRKAIAELGYGTNAKLMVGFAERVWRTRHRSTTYSGI